jgi:hypothetical protein
MKRFSILPVALWLLTSLCRSLAATPLEVNSPDDRIRFELISSESRLRFAIGVGNRPVIADSPLGIKVDGVDIGRFSELNSLARSWDV